jgi:hypothetical protein
VLYANRESESACLVCVSVYITGLACLMLDRTRAVCKSRERECMCSVRESECACLVCLMLDRTHAVCKPRERECMCSVCVSELFVERDKTKQWVGLKASAV